MKSTRRSGTLALAVILTFHLLSGFARTAEEASGFTPIRTYTDQFADVSAGDWYYDTVTTLYELGLTEGKGSGFDPDGELTVAEAVTMAARLRSLYETGDSEAGPASYATEGGSWYLPYISYLQSAGTLGQELEGAYNRPATRAEMAHVLALALPESWFEPVNQELVTAAYDSGQFIQDVTDTTPYQEDILRFYIWGITEGVDETGAFLPDEHVSRCQAAAMASRLAYSELRLTLDWEVLPSYSRRGTTLADLVESDGTFYSSPMPDEADKIDADVRYMLSRGERRITLEYPEGTLNKNFMNALVDAFLGTARNYVEQTYNNVSAPYSTRGTSVTLTFSSSLYAESLVGQYREETMDYALAVHDQMWETGRITADMTDYEKARVYFAWICENCRYDHAQQLMSHSGYRLFHEGIAVCDGYTAAYNLLLKLEDIPCGTYSKGDHIWSTAVLDGKPYHIDTTWGDQSYGVEYRFFAMTELDAVSRSALSVPG